MLPERAITTTIAQVWELPRRCRTERDRRTASYAIPRHAALVLALHEPVT